MRFPITPGSSFDMEERIVDLKTGGNLAGSGLTSTRYGIVSRLLGFLIRTNYFASSA